MDRWSHSGRGRCWARRRALPLGLAGLVAALALGAGSPAQAATATTAAQRQYLQLASSGVARAGQWWDDAKHWYYQRLGGGGSHPLATIWDSVPLFESLDELALANPSRANKAAVVRFANGAERYWDPGLGAHGGFAPYPGQRGKVLAWFDDNGWWGLAFLDAYQATGRQRYLSYAKKALAFILQAGWDPVRGGLWWNTRHPYKAGESLAAATWLSAALYRVTLDGRYLTVAQQLQDWGQAHLTGAGGLYARSDLDPTPMPYVEGAMDAADDALCEATAIQYWCDQNDQLIDRTLARFPTLNMGPQFDAVYLRALLYDYADTMDPRLYALASQVASQALAHAANAEGLYLNAWDGTSVILHDGVPGLLQTHAATVSVFAALATVAPPQPDGAGADGS
jgi:hypothetical protein